jgi:serine/threonine protein kinase
VVEQIGRYKIVELIGHGGMADVYKAINSKISGFSRRLCIKKIRKEYVDRIDFVEMFEAEARIVSHLEHGNIVQVYDFGRDEKTKELYMAMEYVDGLDLESILRLANEVGLQVQIDFAVYVLDCLLTALNYAHTLKIDGVRTPIIHRDVSPHNILVSITGEVKLADFGIAKAKGLPGTDKTRTGVLKGKLAYMSPEQASAGKLPITPVSDLFSAGVVFWETITCERLFKATMEHLISGKVAFDESSMPYYSERLKKYLAGLLAPDPANRFASAEAALKALRRIERNPWTKNDVAELVRLLRNYKEMKAYFVAHRLEQADKASAYPYTQKTATSPEPIKSTRTQTAEQSLGGTEESQNTSTGSNKNSSTAVEKLDSSSRHGGLRHVFVIASGIAAAVVVVLIFLWWMRQSDNEDASQVAPINGETMEIGIPKSSSNLGSKKSALLDNQRKPAKTVLPEDNVSPVEQDNAMQDGEPIPQVSQNEALENQYGDNPNTMLSSKHNVEKKPSSKRKKEEKAKGRLNNRNNTKKESPTPNSDKLYPLDVPVKIGQ